MTNEELYMVVRNMKTGLAPGLPKEFPKACWLELHDTLVRVVNEIFATKAPAYGASYSFLKKGKTQPC